MDVILLHVREVVEEDVMEEDVEHCYPDKSDNKQIVRNKYAFQFKAQNNVVVPTRTGFLS